MYCGRIVNTERGVFNCNFQSHRVGRFPCHINVSVSNKGSAAKDFFINLLNVFTYSFTPCGMSLKVTIIVNTCDFMSYFTPGGCSLV